MDEFDHTVPVERGLHKWLHSGKGQGKSGMYNNWWRDKIEKVGGPGNVTRDNVKDRYDDIRGLFD